MARVTYGESITEYAGSIGGVTFLRNASGPIAKLRSKPPVNPSPDQSTYQTRLAMLVSYWPTLSQANKDAWDVIARDNLHTTPWGVAKKLSGYQWFLSCNLLRLHKYTTVLETPIAYPELFPPDQFTIETSATYIHVAWDPAYNGDSFLIYASLPLRQSSIKLRRSLFLIRVYEYPPLLDYIDLTTLIETLYNVTWSAFWASANCSIIIRIMNGFFTTGYFSSFTSAITKLPPPA